MADDALGTWLPSAGGRAVTLPGSPTAPISPAYPRPNWLGPWQHQDLMDGDFSWWRRYYRPGPRRILMAWLMTKSGARGGFPDSMPT